MSNLNLLGLIDKSNFAIMIKIYEIQCKFRYANESFEFDFSTYLVLLKLKYKLCLFGNINNSKKSLLET